MHEFEFEVRISDQIQTVKMAVGRNLKFYSNIANSLWYKIVPSGKKFTEHTHMNAKFEVRTRKTDAVYSAPSEGRQTHMRRHSPSSIFAA
jgi:hypothetical protein